MDPNSQSNVTKKKKANTIRRDSGYSSHGNLSPVITPSPKNKIAKKRKRVVEIDISEMEKFLFPFNTKMKRKFSKTGNSCSEKKNRVKSKSGDIMEVDAAKCSRAKSKAYRYFIWLFSFVYYVIV